MRLTTVVLIAMAWAGSGFGQEKQAKPDARGKSEGIKVHGHWVIEIRNPDGSLASRHELENALVTGIGGGPTALVSLLLPGPESFTSMWDIELGMNVTASGIFLGSTPAIQQAGVPCSNTLNYCNNSLTVRSGAGGSQVILQGTSPPVQIPITLNTVQTDLWVCNSATPFNCPSYTFTFANTNLNVQPFQLITLTVILSFS
jgi:hypothetical protein